MKPDQQKTLQTGNTIKRISPMRRGEESNGETPLLRFSFYHTFSCFPSPSSFSAVSRHIIANLSRTRLSEPMEHRRAQNYEEKRALWKVGARRRVRGASAGERRDSGSRDATPGANEARRRYSADEAS